MVYVLPQDLPQAHEKMDIYKVPTAHQYIANFIHLVDYILLTRRCMV